MSTTELPDTTDGLQDRVDALERALAAQREQNAETLELVRELSSLLSGSRGLYGQVTRIQLTLEAVLRALYLDKDMVEFPERLTVQRFRINSQNGEDGVTLALLREAGITNRRFADIGCGRNGGNCGVLAQELGFSGLMVDAKEGHAAVIRRRFNPERVTALATWVTREGINSLLAEHGLAGEIDFLSIDIDGNDYWVWEALTETSPRVVVIEYNASFGPDRAVVVPYDEKFDRHAGKIIYYGASLRALTNLAESKGYRLVAVEPRGVNAYFVRNDVAPHVPACDPGSTFHYQQLSPVKGKFDKDELTLSDRVSRLYDYIEAESLPLVEVGTSESAPGSPARP